MADPPTASDPPPVAKGQPLIRPDADLAALAEVTPDDIADAKRYWRGKAPEEFRGLLDAKEAETADGPEETP